MKNYYEEWGCTSNTEIAHSETRSSEAYCGYSSIERKMTCSSSQECVADYYDKEGLESCM